MKKVLALGVVAGALFMTSCEPGGSTPAPATYPGDSLTVTDAARPLVIETTGAWCQYCPNGAEIMTQIHGVMGDSAILVANHVGDWFATDNEASAKFDDNFPTAGVPNFYVNNTDVGQSPTAAAGAALFNEVAFGIEADAMTDSTGKVIVYPRIKCLETSTTDVYMVQSYLLMSGVEARDYGNGVDLNQVSSVAKVTTGSGSVPTVWSQDAAEVNGAFLIKSGTTYTHDEALFSYAGTAVTGWADSDDATIADTAAVTLGPWGMNLADLNPLGNSFAAGDVYGTRYSALQLEITLPTGLPFNPDYSVATMIWKLKQDGSGDYEYINGVISHVD